MLRKKQRSGKSALDEFGLGIKKWAVCVQLSSEELGLRSDESLDIRYDPATHTYSLFVFTFERRPVRLLHVLDRFALKLQRTAREEFERELHLHGS